MAALCYLLPCGHPSKPPLNPLLLCCCCCCFAAGIVPIIASWFISPLMAALACLFFFVVLRSLVLRRANSTNLSFYVLPLLFFITIFINLFFILVSVIVW